LFFSNFLALAGLQGIKGLPSIETTYLEPETWASFQGKIIIPT